ncbi:hypothetical protein GDO81_011206 [Engystomops pustulosus]|uniref:Small EDRK-rich factor-like N-terminal domain-containing protein n=1 Tax=Engystomops pustulosus TaxID=76066 RepID=A0AAV7BCR4_ENGPU|nr:hypothetical protein GDO81_011206 [Engystomops pustulosus]
MPSYPWIRPCTARLRRVWLVLRGGGALRSAGPDTSGSTLRLLSSLVAAVIAVLPAHRSLFVSDMARGHQKIQSQQKNAKKQAEQKKKQGHDQKAAAKAALTQMPDPKTFKQHFESKHPKVPLPPELVGVEA